MKELGEEPPREPDEIDVLGGLPDFTDGAAIAYFRGLPPDQRALVQFYLKLGFDQRTIEEHVYEYVSVFALANPERKDEQAKEAALTEVNRAINFVMVFLDSDDFFPKLYTLPEPKVINGQKFRVGQSGWGSHGNAALLAEERFYAEKSLLPFFDHAREFIRDPRKTSPFLNQRQIEASFEDNRRKLEK